MGTARPLFKVEGGGMDELGKLRQRLAYVEKRLRITEAALEESERALLVERMKREHHERNAKVFHAQALAARIRLVQKRGDADAD